MASMPGRITSAGKNIFGTAGNDRSSTRAFHVFRRHRSLHDEEIRCTSSQKRAEPTTLRRARTTQLPLGSPAGLLIGAHEC